MPSPNQDRAKPHSSMLRSAGLVGFMTLISRITGMLQSRMLAHYLGVGTAFDAFMAAYRLPNLLRRFTAEGTMTAAFLTTVSETEARDGEEATRDLVSRFLGTLALLMVFICAFGVLIMGFITGLMMLGRIGAPDASLLEQFANLGHVLAGTRAAPPVLDLTTTIGRIMFPYLGLVSLTAGLSAVLNLRGRFGLPAAVPIFWNLAFLIFSFSAFRLGPPEWGRNSISATMIFSVAVIVGGLVQLFVLWPSFRGLGYQIRFGLFLGHRGVRQALKRMVPGLLGTGIAPINALISTIIASQLAAGAIGVLANAIMLGEMVQGLFTASVATVSLPLMSKLVEAKDMDGLRGSLATALRGTAVLAIPASIGMAVLAKPIVALIFQTGRYNADDVSWTATTLGYQAVGILFIAASRILAQCLYALKDYRTPAYAGLASMVINVILSIALMRPLNTGGIALANGLASLVGLGMLTWSVRKKLPRLPYRPVLLGWSLMILAAALMGLMAFFGGRMLDVFVFHGVIRTSFRLFPLITLCALAYLLMLMIMRVNEAQDLVSMVKKKLHLQ
jgi:putative peptidoglycan lipid II flippase